MARDSGKHVFGLAKVGERGQIVIPKAARDLFDIKPGDELLVLGDEAQKGLALVKGEVLDYLFEGVVNHESEDGGRPSRP